MGLKTTIGSKGVVTEKVAGNDQVVVDARSIKKVRYHGAGSGDLTSPINVFEGSVAGITGSLPAVHAGNVGLEICVINADDTEDILVAGSQQIDGAGTSFTVTEEAATFVAVSSSVDGYSWIITHVKA